MTPAPRFLITAAALWIGAAGGVRAQEKTPQDSARQEWEAPQLGLPEPVLPPIQPKVKPVPSNVFFGIKAARCAVSSKRGDSRFKEVFYVLRKDTSPEVPPYVPYVYWYSRSKRQIMYTARNAARDGPLLHGKYKKTWIPGRVNKKKKKLVKKLVIEERFFYYGTPHGRWVWLNTRDILLDKRRYFKGWSADAKKSYYDLAQTKLREVIPIQHNERSGPYYAFHPNGKIAATGLYRLDGRVRMWREYYASGLPKRELQYPEDVFSDELPYIAKEWDQKGKLIYTQRRTRDTRARKRP